MFRKSTRYAVTVAILCLSGCPKEFDLLSPSNGAAGLGTSPTLKWKDVGPETGYLVEIDTDATFQPPVTYSKNLFANQTSHTVPSGILQSGKTYFWRVTATDGANQLRATNGPFSFTVGTSSVPQWAIRVGSIGAGSRSDKLSAVRATGDGGVLVVGWSDSGGPTGLWVLKLTALGSAVWQKRFPAIAQPAGEGVDVVEDGGCIVVSETLAGDGCVLRLGPAGETLWYRTMGGTGGDALRAVHRAKDGGWIVGGSTASFGTGSPDAWLLRLTSSGGILWQKSFGGSKIDSVRSVRATADGGCIVAADTESWGSGAADIWVLKCSASGGIQWQKTYGGVHWPKKYSDERAVAVEEIPGNGYLVVGSTSGSIGWDEFFATARDLLLFRLDMSGAVVWKKCLGGDEEDSPSSACATADGGFLIAGTTNSFSSNASAELFSLKIDANGSVLWRRTYFGKAFASASMRPAADGGHYLGGDAITSGASWLDWRILKLAPDGTLAGVSQNVGGEMDTPSLTAKSSSALPKTSSAPAISASMTGAPATMELVVEAP